MIRKTLVLAACLVLSQPAFSQTCQDHCGEILVECSCDQNCGAWGDCCEDVCLYCGDELPGLCDCVPACDGKACGADGCGGACGACGGGEACKLGQCVATDCADGDLSDCNGACATDAWLGDGFCDNGTWGVHYNCVEYDFDGGDCQPCAPDCTFKECGPDGCGGSCGACGDGTECHSVARQCLDLCEEDMVRDCNGGCYYSGWLNSWAGDGECRQASNCAAWDWDGGDCEPCLADCSGTECGADPVCGHLCGSCGEGSTCVLGSCIESDCQDW